MGERIRLSSSILPHISHAHTNKHTHKQTKTARRPLASEQIGSCHRWANTTLVVRSNGLATEQEVTHNCSTYNQDSPLQWCGWPCYVIAASIKHVCEPHVFPVSWECGFWVNCYSWQTRLRNIRSLFHDRMRFLFLIVFNCWWAVNPNSLNYGHIRLISGTYFSLRQLLEKPQCEWSNQSLSVSNRLKYWLQWLCNPELHSALSLAICLHCASSSSTVETLSTT